MAEIFAKFRSQEEKRRENFKAEITRYLPKDLIPGLDDSPPYCEVSISNTTDKLPEITKDDISSNVSFLK